MPTAPERPYAVFLFTASQGSAARIVTDFHSAADAARAAEAFEARFARGELGADLAEVEAGAPGEEIQASKLVALAGLADSSSDATGKIQQGGVGINREKVTDFKARFRVIERGLILEVGRKAVRIVPKKAPR